MKFSTVAVAAGAAAVGYVLGTKAGRAQFERIKSRANELAHDPRVQSGVSTVAGEVRKNADRLPDPVAGVVRTAAEKVETATKTEPTPGTTGTSTIDTSTVDTSTVDTSTVDTSTDPDTGTTDPGTSPVDPGAR
jgi:hypothetical protein